MWPNSLHSAFTVRQVFVVQSTETWQFVTADLSFVGNLAGAGRLSTYEAAVDVGHTHLGDGFIVHSFYQLEKIGEEVIQYT